MYIKNIHVDGSKSLYERVLWWRQSLVIDSRVAAAVSTHWKSPGSLPGFGVFFSISPGGRRSSAIFLVLVNQGNRRQRKPQLARSLLSLHSLAALRIRPSHFRCTANDGTHTHTHISAKAYVVVWVGGLPFWEISILCFVTFWLLKNKILVVHHFKFNILRFCLYLQ